MGGAGNIVGMNVSVSIQHPNKEDLQIALLRNGQVVSLFNNEGGTRENVFQTFNVSAFNNTSAAGTYTLRVTNESIGAFGFLNNWSITMIRDTASTTTAGSNGRILLDSNARTGNVISDIGSTLTATGPADTNPYSGAVTPYIPDLFIGGTETYGFR